MGWTDASKVDWAHVYDAADPNFLVDIEQLDETTEGSTEEASQGGTSTGTVFLTLFVVLLAVGTLGGIAYRLFFAV